MIRIVIMASGYSRRMGKDKLTEIFCGKPVVQWVIDAAKETGATDIHLVYRNPGLRVIAELSDIVPLYNPWSFLGQSASLRVAVESLLPAKPILFLAGDQPLITPGTLLRMMRRFEKDCPDILCASWKGQKTLPTLFSGALCNQLMSLEGDKGGRGLIESGRFWVEYQELSCEEEQWDIDTEKDMERIEQWVEGKRETGSINGKQTPRQT